MAGALARDCAASLDEHLAGRTDTALERAREAGSRAADAGMGVREIAAAFQAAAGAITAPSVEREQLLDSALSCLCEGLKQFEAASTATEESAARIQRRLDSLSFVEAQLRHQNQQLIAAREAEQKQEARYHALFELAPDGYLVTGIEGAIREANAAAAALLRTPREMLPGRLLSEFIRESDHELLRERLRAFHRGAIDRIENWQIELEPRCSPGTPAVLTVAAAESGTASEAGLRWIIRDDTQRQRAESEQATRLVGHARAEAARRFEFLAEVSGLLMGSIDLEAALTEAARMTASFLGGWCFVHLTDADGSPRQLTAAHADASVMDLAGGLRKHCLYRGMEESGRASLPTHSEIIEPVTNEWYDRIADGPAHAVLLRRLHSRTAMLFPLRLHGRLLGMLTFFSNPNQEGFREQAALCEDLGRRCTAAIENARLYRQVVAERDKAERANAVKDEFMAILSHELRHPLTPLSRWTSVLEGHPAIARDPLLSEAVKAMGRSAAALSRMINDCLDLTSISAGKLHLECHMADLNQIVREEVESVRATCLNRALRLSTEFAAEPLPVKGDPMRLHQVAANLLSNAAKYTPPGGTITVGTVCATDQIGFWVADTGVGIQPEMLETVFEPFRQAADTWLTSPSGLGLGLAISHQIVGMHEGEIWAESPGIGRGSTFRVRLPKASVAEMAAADGAGAGRAKILVVEDSPDIRFLLKTELELSGHQVVTACNGEEGIAAARAHQPDLLISDVKMPVMDGYRMMRAVREEPSLRETPAIALTGLGTDVARALAAGFNACVSKPADSGELTAALQRLLAARGRIAKSASEE